MKNLAILAAALLSFGAHATAEHDTPKPAKVIKSARATSASTSSTGPIGITNQASVAPVFGGTSAMGGSLNLAGAQIGTQERSAPSSFAPAGSAPVTSCRLFFGVAGSQTGGSLGAGLPMGNDQVCITQAQFALMDRLGGFQAEDYLRAACKVEGMSETSRCKAMKQEPSLAVYQDRNLLP